MAQLYNPLSKPSQSAAGQLSIYLDEVNWASCLVPASGGSDLR